MSISAAAATFVERDTHFGRMRSYGPMSRIHRHHSGDVLSCHSSELVGSVTVEGRPRFLSISSLGRVFPPGTRPQQELLENIPPSYVN